MKARIRMIIIGLVLGIAFVPSAHSAAEWQKVMSQDDVDVYTRSVDGTQCREFKGETTIEAPRNVCESLLKDVSTHMKWIPNTKMAKVVRNIDEKNDIYYGITSMPWPVQNRDAVVHRVFLFEPDVTNVKMWAVTDPQAPETEENFRIKEIEIQWFFYAVDDSHTRVTYAMRCNPGGNIPISIVNFMSKSLPYDTLMGMKRMVKSKEGQK